MTAIIAHADGKTVYMGGDSCAIDGWTRITLRERKVFQLGDLLIGGSGLLHVVQSIRLMAVIPEQREGVDDQTYLVTKVMPALKQHIEDAGKSMIEADGSTALMIGFHGVLYVVTPGFCVYAPDVQRYMLGSGGDLAMGAFDAVYHDGADVEAVMLQALEIAGKWNGSVAGPYYVLKDGAA